MLEIKTNRKPGELGLFSGIPYESHKGEAISNTKLGILLENPARFHDVNTETKPLKFGKLVDNLIFEPEKADKSDKLYPKAIKMIQAIKKHPSYSKLLTGGHPQLLGFFMIDGILCKIIPDYVKYFPESNAIIITDLKTTKSCNPKELKLSIKKYGYYRQAAFYIDGIKAITGIKNVVFVNFFVESTLSRSGACLFNHIECLPVPIPEDEPNWGINKGREEYMLALERYKYCKEKGEFKGYAYTLGQEDSLIVDITKGI